MKKFTAFIAAAILALSVSLTVFAEPVEDDIVSEISESSIVQSSDISSDEKLPELSGYIPKTYYTSYPVPEAEMYIDLPNDMYILTKNIDENSPVLKACKITKAQLLKSFEQTGNYIKASSKDFTCDITVNILKNKNTTKINNLATLDDEEIQSIVNNTLKQPMYTGWSKNIYNNSMYLSFPIKFKDENTNVAGIQEYTIIKGTRIVITFQSYTGEIDEAFNDIISYVMESIVFDGIDPNPASESSEPVENNTSVKNLDIRYIYLLLAALIALIFLTFIITTAMRYKKSHHKKLPEPVIETHPQPKEEKIQEKNDIISKDETPQNINETQNEETTKNDETLKEETSEAKPEPNDTSENIPTPAEKEASESTDSDQKTEAVSEEEPSVPVVQNQLELVEIAFRIIPVLTHEDEDLTEIWNFIYKKFNDIEYFSNYSNKNSSDTNAFYKINSQSDINTPPKAEKTIDDEIRSETLETVVGDSTPEAMKFDAQKAVPAPQEDLNELIYATPPTYPENDTELDTETENEPDKQNDTLSDNDDDSKIKPMQTSEMKLGTPPKRPKNEIYKAKEESVKNQNIQLEISKDDDGSIKIGANNGQKSLDVEIEKHKKNEDQ